MSEYKGIKGFQVTTRTEDPTPFAQALADNPYAGSWASGGNLNTARTYSGASGLGTQTDSLLFGGRKNSSPASNKAETEKYNGTSWTELNDLPAAKEGVAGFGTTTNAVSAGGGDSPAVANPTCTWDGTSWTEVNEINTAREKPKGAGTYTAGLIFSGNPHPSVSAATEEWDGTNWTTGGSLNTGRSNVGNAGATQTAALAFGGGPSASNAVEQYNGTAWTEIAEINTARMELGGLGTTTSALAMGGYDDSSTRAIVESWDGSSWTEVNDLGTARNNASGSGTGTLGLLSGGNNPNETAATEEWSFSGIQPTDLANYVDAITGDFYYNSTTGQFKTVNDGGAPIGTWASGGNMNTGRGYLGAAGTQTAALAISGAPTPPFTYVANVENYNGSSWTEIADVNGARHEASGFGTTTAAIYAAGYGPNSLTPTERTDKTESWNGSSWTEVADTNEIKNIMGSGGTATAGVIYGGAVHPNPAPTATANTEYWNGSAWSEQNNMNQARSYLAGFGTQTSITAAGGNIGTAGTTPTNVVETWDGTSWTEVSEVNTNRTQYASSGASSPSGLIFGGYTTTIVANTEAWDGSSWTETGDLSTAVRTAGRGPVGTNTSALNFGGQTPGPSSSATEEFTAADFQIKTVTTS
jgi:hypothetical protein